MGKWEGSYPQAVARVVCPLAGGLAQAQPGGGEVVPVGRRGQAAPSAEN